jgi:hypothetical protein
MNVDLLRKENRDLSKKVKLLSSLLLLACAVIVVSVIFYLKEQGMIFKVENDPVRPKPPYFAEVSRIIKPLQYSGFQMFTAKDVYLSLDFEKGTWTLYNIHSFDEKGKFILQDGKYGTCGELAAYTYDKVKPLFDDDYEIKFVTVFSHSQGLARGFARKQKVLSQERVHHRPFVPQIRSVGGVRGLFLFRRDG